MFLSWKRNIIEIRRWAVNGCDHNFFFQILSTFQILNVEQKVIWPAFVQ